MGEKNSKILNPINSINSKPYQNSKPNITPNKLNSQFNVSKVLISFVRAD